MAFFQRFRESVAERTQKFKTGLSKTRNAMFGRVEDLFRRSGKLDEDFYEALEEIFITSDMGVSTVLSLVEELRETAKKARISQPGELMPVLKSKLQALVASPEEPMLRLPESGLGVILFVGVNGVGKTTTIGKLAYLFQREGKKVLLAAGDTFRAGAIEQLEAWGERVGVDVIRHQEGSDPAAVIFDALAAARSRKADILLCDTAGRLHNNSNLMDELNKVYRVIRREIPDAPHEVLLVLDATTGQNALSQARLFAQSAGVTGLVLTKLDGTAKGGIVVAIRRELDLPVKFVGLGEQVEDLQPFDAELFIQGLFAGSQTEGAVVKRQ